MSTDPHGRDHDADDEHTGEHHDPRRRGRRSTDWTLRRAITIGTALGMAWAGWVTVSAFLGAKIATRQEVDGLAVHVDTLDKRVTALTRQREVDARDASRRDSVSAEAASQDRRMITGLVKLQCLSISAETAALVGLPCSTLGIAPTRRRRE